MNKFICYECGKEVDCIQDLLNAEKNTCSNCNSSLFFLKQIDRQQLDYEDISKTQQKLLQLLKSFIDKYHYVPSAEYLRDELNLRSVSTIYYHLLNLSKLGYIYYKKGHMPTLKVAPKRVLIHVINLTEQEKKCLKYLNYYIDTYNTAPKLKDLKEHLEVNSFNTVSYYLDTLERTELITRNKFKSQNIEITEKGKFYLLVLNEDEINE